LAGVQQLLAANVSNEKPVELPAAGLRVFRRKGYRVPAKLIFFSIFAIPVAIILSIIADSPGPLAIPFLLFLAGITTLSYTFLFGKDWRSENETRYLPPHAVPNALNEHREYVSPIGNFGRATTNELAQPPSVTEKTTNLLREDLE
jgi:hypothetical protein